MVSYPDEFFAEIGEQFRSLLSINEYNKIEKDKLKTSAVTDVNKRDSEIYCSECDIWFSKPNEYNIHKFDDNHRLKAGLII